MRGHGSYGALPVYHAVLLGVSPWVSSWEVLLSWASSASRVMSPPILSPTCLSVWKASHVWTPISSNAPLGAYFAIASRYALIPGTAVSVHGGLLWKPTRPVNLASALRPWALVSVV